MSVTEVTEPRENAKVAGTSARTIASTGAFPVAGRSAVWRALRRLVRRHRRPMTITTCLLWLAAATGLVGPWLLGRIVDDLARGATTWSVGLLAGGMLVALLAQAGFTYEANRRTQLQGAEIVAELREEFIESVVQLPLSTVEAAGTGDLLTRTTRDVRTVSDTVRFGIPQTSIAVMTIVTTFVASLLASGLLTLAMAVAIPPLVAVSRWYLRRSTPAYAAVGAAYSVLNQVTSSNAEGARTIDPLSLAGVRGRAADDAIRMTFRSTVRTAMLRTVLFPVTNFAFSLQVMATLLWGGWLAARGVTTAGAVATVTLYAVQLGPPVEQLIRWLDSLQSSGASFARLLGVSEVPPDRVPTEARPKGSTIELRDVTFEYEPRRPVLHGVSLTLRPGERLAIVGPSGSGKSTLARLIAGVDGPSSGTATVGGVPLMALPLAALRGEVALATQEQHVFQGSIADNVRLGRADATDGELLDALAAVGAGWVLDLPGGLNTPIGDGAAQLTPAQAQHIALARLVLLDPHTLVLDEATALLDPTAARALERSMALAMRSRTIVAIAHRLHTARDADRIAVIVDGRLAELGSHDELLASDGPYAHLWRTWRESD